MSKKEIKRVHELVSEFKQRQGKRRKTAKLRFKGVGNQDVYNITAPFPSANKIVIAGRVEPREHEKSTVVFFEEIDDIWVPIPGAPTFALQDPFVTFISGELIFGGVRVKGPKGFLQWKTVLYRGPDIFHLKEFFHGPEGMKDIRLCDLGNNGIGIFTRPQGDIGGRGKIGYVEINCLEELTIEVIESATLLEDKFHDLDWGGENEAHLLANGEIGVLAHAAYYEDDEIMGAKHYYATSFIFDPIKKTFRDYKIIASRDQFEDGPSKREHISNVIFSSGLVHSEGKTRLYAGVSDAEAHWIEIDNPFLPIEETKQAESA